MGVPFAISKSFSGMAYSPAVPVSEFVVTAVRTTIAIVVRIAITTVTAG